MKFLLAAVSIIVVYTADGRDLSNEPGEQQPATTDEAMIFPDGEGGQDLPGGPVAQNSEKQDQQHLRNNTFAKLDRSDLVNEDGDLEEGDLNQQDEYMQHGRKGKNTMAKKIQSLEKEMSEINDKLDNITNSISNIDSKQGCPEGLFFFAPSNQCFKMLNDTTRTWDAAKTQCHKLGLQLAMPYEPISLRSYLVTKYGYGIYPYTFIGARGDGKYIRWVRTKQLISKYSPLWWSGMPSSYVSTSYCLGLATYEYGWKIYPNQPYYNGLSCSGKRWALCELVRK